MAPSSGMLKNWRNVDLFNQGQPKGFSFFEVLEDGLSSGLAVNPVAPEARKVCVSVEKAPDFLGDGYTD